MRSMALVLVLVVGGCLPAPLRKDRFVAPVNAIRAECASQPTHLTRERCANPRIYALYAADGHVPLDIASDYLARRQEIADEMDKGQITEAQGAALIEDAKSVANARSTALAARRNAELDAAIDSLAAAQATINANPPQSFMLPPVRFSPQSMMPPPASPPMPVPDICSMMSCPRAAVPSVQYVPVSPGDPLNAGLNSVGYPTR